MFKASKCCLSPIFTEYVILRDTNVMTVQTMLHVHITHTEGFVSLVHYVYCMFCNVVLSSILSSSLCTCHSLFCILVFSYLSPSHFSQLYISMLLPCYDECCSQCCEGHSSSIKKHASHRGGERIERSRGREGKRREGWREREGRFVYHLPGGQQTFHVT